MKSRAERVKTKALKNSPSLSFKLEDVVLVPLYNVDWTKVDSASLVGVIVLINKDRLLHRAYVFHALGAVPKASNGWVTNDLEDAFNDWKDLPKITEWEATHSIVSWRTGKGEVQLQGWLHVKQLHMQESL